MPRLISISELIDRPWEQYRASLPLFLSIMGWMLLAGLLYVIALLLYPLAGDLLEAKPLTASQTAGTILYGLTHTLIAPIIGLWAYVGVVTLGNSQAKGGRGDVRKAMREGWKRFLPTLGTSIVFAGAILLAFVLTLGPGFLLAVLTTGRWDGTVMVLLRNLLVVAGAIGSLILTVRWFNEFQFATLLAARGDATGMEAMRRSRRLVRGRFWAVLVRSLFPKILFLLVGVIAWWLILSVANVAVGLLLGGVTVETVLRLGTLLNNVVNVVLIPMLIMPLLYLVDVHLVRNLEERV